jgi:hypothetical protein
VTWTVVLALLGLVGAFAWATHHPESRLLVRAEALPGVGPWIARFRAGYLPAPEPQRPAEAGKGGEVEVIVEWVPHEVRPDGGRPAPPPSPRVWVAAGEPLRAAPDPAAPVLGHLERYLWLPVLEERAGWVRVAGDQGEGWVRPVRPAEQGPPLGDAAELARPLPARAPDPQRLRLALELLGTSGAAGRLGPLTLYTDADPRALWHLDRLAAQVEPAYRQRYGREPLGGEREAVVLFATEAGYRRFQAGEAQLAGLPASGHATSGLIALYSDGTLRSELASTLVHEMVHLLNRRALGPALPPWLDEGLADDLAASEIGEAGDLRPARLGGSTVTAPGRLEYHGAVAAVRQVLAAHRRGTAVPLERLTGLDWEAFVRSDDSALHYAEAGLFVRYLVEEPELAAAFRRFLAAVAEGGPADGEALRAELGRSWDRLDAGMAVWVAAQDGT